MDFAAHFAIIATRSNYLQDRMESMNIAQNLMPILTAENLDLSTGLQRRTVNATQPGMLIYVSYENLGAGIHQSLLTLTANRSHVFFIVKSVGDNWILQFMHQSGTDVLAAAQHLHLGTEICIPRCVCWEVVHNLAILVQIPRAAFHAYHNPAPQAPALPAGFAQAIGAAIAAGGGAGGGAGQAPIPPVVQAPYASSHTSAAFQRFYNLRPLYTPECWAAMFYTGALGHQAGTLNLDGIKRRTEAILNNEDNFGRERFANNISPATIEGLQHCDFGHNAHQLNWNSIVDERIFNGLPDIEKFNYPNRVLQPGINILFGARLSYVINTTIAVSFQSLLRADEGLSYFLLLPILSTRLNLLQHFDPAIATAVHAALPPGGIDLETHIRAAMVETIAVNLESPCIKAIHRNPTAARHAAEAFIIKKAGGGGGGRGGGRGGGGGGGGGGPAEDEDDDGAATVGVKRDAAGVTRSKDKWLRLCPYPDHRLCWDWARNLPPCRGLNGDASLCKSANGKRQHRFPAGVDKGKFLAWLAQKP
jgi:hypothetical protein